MTWAGSRSGAAGEGFGAGSAASRASAGRARPAAGSGFAFGSGSASASSGASDSARAASSSSSSGSSASARACRSRPRTARRRGLADAVDHALAGGPRAADDDEPEEAGDHDPAHDPEQLIQLRGVYGRARRVHGGWDSIIKGRCSSTGAGDRCDGHPDGDLGNLLALGERATVYTVLARVLKVRAPVTIHLTYGHVTEVCIRSAL
jgi:hypothetical protein